MTQLIQRNQLIQRRQIIRSFRMYQVSRHKAQMVHCNRLIQVTQVRVTCHQQRQLIRPKIRRLRMWRMSSKQRLPTLIRQLVSNWHWIRLRATLMSHQPTRRLIRLARTRQPVMSWFPMAIQVPTSPSIVKMIMTKRMRSFWNTLSSQLIQMIQRRQVHQSSRRVVQLIRMIQRAQLIQLTLVRHQRQRTQLVWKQLI